MRTQKNTKLRQLQPLAGSGRKSPAPAERLRMAVVLHQVKNIHVQFIDDTIGKTLPPRP